MGYTHGSTQQLEYNKMTISTALTAIALEFARACYSEVEEDTNYGRKCSPAQIYIEHGACEDYWDTPNLIDYTVIQLGMLADMQAEADEMYWVHSAAHQINRDFDQEDLIIRTIAMGAGDRETAVRWLEAA